METKIILSKKAEILDPPLIDTFLIEEKYSLLKIRSRMLTISPLMREVLEYSRTPHTVLEIIKWVCLNKGCSYESVYMSVYLFIKRMFKFNVLVLNDEKSESESDIITEVEKDNHFGNFILLNRIGKNHKVVVYKCKKAENDHRFFTLKLLIDNKSKDTFLREYNFLKRLPYHKNIRGCIEVSEYNNVPYMLLEYIEGKPLSDCVSTISLESKLKVISQILSAIQHLHHYRVLHGDIHSSNFLIDIHENVHLIDLGMAYTEGEKKLKHGGIARYMPPERMPNHSFVFSKRRGDYISEVFQLGICFYYLLKGDYPFKGVLLKDLAHAIKHEAPLPLVETCCNEIIPVPVVNVIFRALQKDPLCRYQKVREMLHAWKFAVNQKERALSVHS